MSPHPDTGAASAALLDPEEVQTIENHVTRVDVERDINDFANIGSRHIEHSGNRTAVDQILAALQAMGLSAAKLEFTSSPPESLRLHNVEARIPASGRDGIVLVTAHLDSTGDREPGYQPQIDPAPGADDDASGIAGVLAAARAIRQLMASSRPRHEIRFVLFNAEEHERVGSGAYVEEHIAPGANVVAAFHLDMIGYDRSPLGDFELHVGYEDDSTVERLSRDLANEVVQLVGVIYPQLTPQVYPDSPGTPDPGEDFSDHTSFHQAGFRACLVSENFFPGPGSSSPDVNPDYHLGDDTAANLNFDYAVDIARAVTAAAWYKATR
jgi:bacterial leucyl aminopeptidase